MSAGRLILIGYCEPANLPIMAPTLHEDYEIWLACNGSDANLRDVVMPGQDGYEVCQQIWGNALLCESPVIFTTPRDAAENELHAIRSGPLPLFSHRC